MMIMFSSSNFLLSISVKLMLSSQQNNDAIEFSVQKNLTIYILQHKGTVLQAIAVVQSKCLEIGNLV